LTFLKAENIVTVQMALVLEWRFKKSMPYAFFSTCLFCLLFVFAYVAPFVYVVCLCFMSLPSFMSLLVFMLYVFPLCCLSSLYVQCLSFILSYVLKDLECHIPTCSLLFFFSNWKRERKEIIVSVDWIWFYVLYRFIQ
jgi:hypothetical protein